MPRPRILAVGGHSAQVEIVRQYFGLGDDYELEAVEYCDEAMTTLLRRPFTLVLLLSLRVQWTRSIAPVEYEEAMGFLHQMRTLHSTIPVVVASAAVGASERAISMGAFAFIPQPIQLEELRRVVARALEGLGG